MRLNTLVHIGAVIVIALICSCSYALDHAPSWVTP